jgi:hypothetical protein
MNKGCGGRIELRVFNIVIAGNKKSRQMVDAQTALREWCGRAGGSIPRNAGLLSQRGSRHSRERNTQRDL